MADTLRQEIERRMREAFLHFQQGNCPDCKAAFPKAVAVCEEMVRKYEAEVPHLVKAAVQPERERCAKITELAAERIKHTTHRDGLGMGDQLTERRLLEVADAIRKDSKPTSDTERRDLDTSIGRTHFYGDGCDEEHGKPPSEPPRCQNCNDMGIGPDGNPCQDRSHLPQPERCGTCGSDLNTRPELSCHRPQQQQKQEQGRGKEKPDG